MHVLLGDIGMEEERFESSASDYAEAIKLLVQQLEVHIAPLLLTQTLHSLRCALWQSESQPALRPIVGTTVLYIADG